MHTRISLAAALCAALVGHGCAMESDCPQCEDRCWEGDTPCVKCKKRHRCPLDAAPETVDPEEPAPVG